ncbi:hypothetical protein C5167_006282 [Papaver somniferum]|uniref:Uncharacterized protein n=1 Tax=Papaver somniferum TaxID=3469 RepID=A0A4Y7JDV3_PAPSO|nr:hypothetical protein C5167_006282 [Papaver somniferum]
MSLFIDYVICENWVSLEVHLEESLCSKEPVFRVTKQVAAKKEKPESCCSESDLIVIPRKKSIDAAASCKESCSLHQQQRSKNPVMMTVQITHKGYIVLETSSPSAILMPIHDQALNPIFESLRYYNSSKRNQFTMSMKKSSCKYN